jgi:hypothetical protein
MTMKISPCDNSIIEELKQGHEYFCENICKHFCCNRDRNGEIAVSFCNHPENSSEYEGNTIPLFCPLVKQF